MSPRILLVVFLGVTVGAGCGGRGKGKSFRTDGGGAGGQAARDGSAGGAGGGGGRDGAAGAMGGGDAAPGADAADAQGGADGAAGAMGSADGGAGMGGTPAADAAGADTGSQDARAADAAAAPDAPAADAPAADAAAGDAAAPDVSQASDDSGAPAPDAPEGDAPEGDAPPAPDAPVTPDAPEGDAGPDTDSGAGTDVATTMDTAPVDTAPPPPTITLAEVVPAAVSRQQSATVELVGTLFAAGAKVTLTSCSDATVTYELGVTVSSPSSARFTLAADPTRVQGFYDVTITNTDGKKASLDCALRVIDAAPPTVTDVVPPNAWTGVAGDGVSSDQTVQVTGTGFAPTPRVRFRSVADPTRIYDALTVTWVSASSLTAVVPSETQRMPAGDYHVFVENPNLLGGQWMAGTAAGIFKVTSSPPPRIDSIDPVRCPIQNPSPPCPQITAIGDHFQVGAKLSFLVPAGQSCPAGFTKVAGASGDECQSMSATRPDAQHIGASMSGLGQGLYPLKVTNPDGQFDIFYSFLVTASSSGHLSGGFTPLTPKLVEGRWRHAAEYGFDDFGNSYIYVLGGQKDAAGAPLDTVEVTTVSITGEPSPFATAVQYKPAKDPTNLRGANTLASGRTGLAVARVGAHVYAIGGALASTNVAGAVSATNTVERARILGYETMPRRHLPHASGTVGLPKGTWYYRVSAVSSEGESLPSLPMQLIGGQGQITVCWDPPPQSGLAYKYNVYRSLSSDGRANTERLLAVEVAGPCYVDDGFGPNLPAPGQVSGTDVTTPPGKPGLAAGSWSYRVSATKDGAETLAGYAASVTIGTAGKAAVQLRWAGVFGATYNVYRGATAGTEVLIASGVVSPSFLDDGSALPGTARPKDGVAPLPPGSLTKWAPAPLQGGGTAALAEAREGADAVVIVTTDAAAKSHTFLFVGGGRRDNATDTTYGAGAGADSNYHKTIERAEVMADGSLSAFAIEAQKMNRPRAFFPLLTTQFSDQTPSPPAPKEPPCEDLDGDGYQACSCFRPLASCVPGAKTAACAPDCNDLVATVHPAATEICGDGVDQDCDANACDYAAGTCPGCGGSDRPCGAGEMPPPPPPVVQPTGPQMPPGCTPRDDDGDGFFSCSCFAPAAGCAFDTATPSCAADCCDKPGDPGCPAAVSTLAGARLINPGVAEVNCDGVDNNCGVENFYSAVNGLYCGGGTDMCYVVAAERSSRLPASVLGDRDAGARFGRSKTARPAVAPRVVYAAADPVWLLAAQGDDTYDVGGPGNRGSVDFEACRVNTTTGHLEECSSTLPGSLWVTQDSTLPNGQGNHGHDALLYFGYVFAFRGVSTEAPGQFATPASASASRFPVNMTPADPAELLGGIESASVNFSSTRAYYTLVRLNSYIYVLGGTDGTNALSDIERRQQ